MEASSPAKLYATLVGAVLTIAGIIGFFYSASFGSPGEVDKVFGILAVNGWHNVVHLATGSARPRRRRLRRAPIRPRPRRSSTSWSRSGASSSAAATRSSSIVPVNTADNILHLILGLTGLAAGAATPASVPARTAPA